MMGCLNTEEMYLNFFNNFGAMLSNTTVLTNDDEKGPVGRLLKKSWFFFNLGNCASHPLLALVGRTGYFLK